MSRSIFKYSLLVTACCTGLLIVASARYFLSPDLKSLRDNNPTTTSFIRYREQQWKKQGSPRNVSLRWVSYNRISKNVIKAVVVSEDAKFWRHHGFDLAEIKNAARTNMEEKRFKFGASTISQQLAKNLYLRPSKNIFRKIAEAILTWRLERTLTKKRILEIYLNVIEWGDGIFGIGQASRHYYGKSPDALTREEAARLAVILPSPRRYNPLQDGGYIERRAAVIMERAFPGSVSPVADSGGNSLADTVSQTSIDTTAVPIDVEVREGTAGPVADPVTDTTDSVPATTKPVDSGTVQSEQQSVGGDTVEAR